MRVFLGIVTLLVLLAGCDRAATPAQNPAAAIRPAPELTSSEVVRQQMLALQHNDVPHADAGAAIAFRFASPENRVFTGPVERFAQMVHSPTYAPMLNCRRFEVSEPDVRDDFARHMVWVDDGTGRTLTYVFLLRRQAEGEFADCWMVDSVVPMQMEPGVPGGPGFPGPPAPQEEPPPRRIAV